VALIEGLALRRPAPSIAHVHRQVVGAAVARGWAAPSYRTVHAIVSGLDRGMVTLAHDGPVRYRERFELVAGLSPRGRYAERDLAGRPHGA